MTKKVNIDYLFLDVTTCTRCQGSDLNLESALKALKVEFPEYEFLLNKIHVKTVDLAIQYQLVSSPTIRVDGKDLPIELRESNCDTCGDFCGDSVDCRLWVHEGETFESAPTSLLVDLISDYLNGKKDLVPLDSSYALPENLIHFFSARLNKTAAEPQQSSSCGCGDGGVVECC